MKNVEMTVEGTLLNDQGGSLQRVRALFVWKDHHRRLDGGKCHDSESRGKSWAQRLSKEVVMGRRPGILTPRYCGLYLEHHGKEGTLADEALCCDHIGNMFPGLLVILQPGRGW